MRVEEGELMGDGRTLPLENVLVSLLCSMGASKLSGKPPRGALAYQLQKLNLKE